MIAEELPYFLPVILQCLRFYFQVSDQIGQEIKLNTKALQSNTDTDILLSFTAENLSLYINCSTEDPESRHDERSRKSTLTSLKLTKMKRSDQSNCGFGISNRVSHNDKQSTASSSEFKYV